MSRVYEFERKTAPVWANYFDDQPASFLSLSTEWLSTDHEWAQSLAESHTRQFVTLSRTLGLAHSELPYSQVAALAYSVPRR